MEKHSKVSEAERAAFLGRIESGDAEARRAAWETAGPMGAGAVAPLGKLAASDDRGAAKAAKESLKRIAFYAARPGAGREARNVTAELLKLTTPEHPRMVRADALHLVGVIGDGAAVGPLTALLTDADIREDARLALERIPGSAATSALRKAERNAAPDFRANVAQSLHNRNLTKRTVGLTS